MSAARQRWRPSVGRTELVLLGLIAVIQIGGYLAHMHYGALPMESPKQEMTSAADGGMLIAVIVVESLLLIAVYKAWQRVPEWIRTRLMNGLKKIGYIGALPAAVGYYLIGQQWGSYLLLFLLGVAGLEELLERYQLDWITHNTLALGLGIVFAAAFSKVLHPVAVITLLVGLALWDRIAVDLSDWMDKIMSASANFGIPNYIVIPVGWRMDWDRFHDWLTASDRGDKPEDVSFLIGLGDFVMPAVLMISAGAAAPENGILIASGVFVGTCLGMLRLTTVLHRREGAAPALPWANTGAIVGYLVAVLLSGVPLLAALGVGG